ncbi:hypothetical protein MASR1M66_20250 [Aminivibrio sp.]
MFSKRRDQYGIDNSGALEGIAGKKRRWKASLERKKNEVFLRQKKYSTRDEAKPDIFRYIEIFYNRKRLYSELGYKTPGSYEKERLHA